MSREEQGLVVLATFIVRRARPKCSGGTRAEAGSFVVWLDQRVGNNVPWILEFLGDRQKGSILENATSWGWVVVNWNKFSGLSVTSDGIISLGNGLGNQARVSTCCTQRA